MTKFDTISEQNIDAICGELAAADPHLSVVVDRYGTPPLWARPTGFATLLEIILEQQVSLASAKACFDKLAAHIGDVTPERFLTINDVVLKTIGFSRQKTAYARHLSQAILEGRIDLDSVHKLPDDAVTAERMQFAVAGVEPGWAAVPEPRGWIDMSRGLNREVTEGDGRKAALISDETTNRGFWRQYRTVMSR